MVHLTRRHLLQAAGASAALTGVSPSLAAPQGRPFLQPGVRIVMLGASASLPGDRSQLVPDAEGGWVNKATGEKFSEQATRGTAGAGITVYDVLHADGSGIVAWSSRYLIADVTTGATTFMNAEGIALPPGDRAGEVWIAPAVLAATRPVVAADRLVARTVFEINGKRRQALRQAYYTGSGWTSYTHDLDTGLMLAMSTTAQTGGGVAVSGDQAVASSGTTFLTMTRLLEAGNVRQTGWTRQAYPDSLLRYSNFVFQGRMYMEVQGTGVGRQDVGPASMTYRVIERRATFLKVYGTLTQPYQDPQSAEMIIPAGTLGSLWMNPSALAGLRPGQAVDEIVPARARIEAYAAQGGEIGLALTTTYSQNGAVYDLRTGQLKGFDMVSINGQGRTERTLRLTSMT